MMYSFENTEKDGDEVRPLTTNQIPNSYVDLNLYIIRHHVKPILIQNKHLSFTHITTTTVNIYNISSPNVQQMEIQKGNTFSAHFFRDN